MFSSKILPLPFFKLDYTFEIKERSNAADKLFKSAQHFLDLVDEDSKVKAAKILTSNKSETELVLKTFTSDIALFKVNISRDDDFIYLILTEQNSRMEALVHQVELHRKRLAETDLQLLAKKEEAEDSYNKIVELSVPFINLTKKTVLIPLFGSLTADLIEKNEVRVLTLLTETSAEQILIDFNGVGTITQPGVESLANLVQEFRLIGTSTIFSSLTPAQAKEIYRIHMDIDVTYVQNLSQAVEKYSK